MRPSERIPIRYEKPPMWDRVIAQFPTAAKGDTIFSYATCIYRPNVMAGLPDSLMAHERVHCERQLVYPGGVEAWWDRYLDDPRFRLDEEIPAHRAEIAVASRKIKSDSMRSHALSRIAARLAGPLYGNLITVAEAKKLLTAP